VEYNIYGEMVEKFVRFNLCCVITLGFAVLSGCAYRLPAYNLPSQQRLIIVARSPERYVVAFRYSKSAAAPVATDGRVKIDVPRLPRACSVYLFNQIRISEGFNPMFSKSIYVVDAGNIAAKLSLEEMSKLPVDDSGYHILKIKR